MLPAFIDKSKIPHCPGVYIYKNNKGRVLYVGKAIDLFHRVSSYFSPTNNEKTALLVKNIARVDTIVVQSELEALILEANLIKKYLPSFNIKLTDDKDYLYIAITKEDFPKIITARRKELKEMKKNWGPFPSSNTVKATLKALRKVFPWCASNNRFDKNKPCFYYHLNLCPGSCAGLISFKDHQKIISRFAKFMDGKKDELVKELTKEMDAFSKNQQYEKANNIKKTLEGITYLTQPNRTRLYLENPNFLQEETQLALKQLQEDLKLANIPERIEGYDISNIQGKEAVGSMVVLTHGEIDKSQYRKFKIRISGKPNDVGMLREMLVRRFNHPDWPKPDLVIIDGGRGQVNAVKLNVPVFGLAKRLEWLYPPVGEIIKLPKNSLSLKLLQKLRDEAHRFAISYHRKLRSKRILNNIK